MLRFSATVHRLLFAIATLATLCRAESIQIPYRVANECRVSLAIYNRDGQLVRTLLTGAPRNPGEYAETWDGLDRYGFPQPVGTYTWKLLTTSGLRAEFITQVGQNVDPVWERATGNHEPPNAAAIDATGLYRIGATNEGAHWGVKTDLNGRHVWTNDRWSKDPWVQSTVAVTLVGDRLFELLPYGEVYGYNTLTGRVFTGGDYSPEPWSLRAENSADVKYKSDDERRRGHTKFSPRDIAGDSANGLIVAAYPQFNLLQWFDATNGKQVDAAREIHRPVAVATAKDGSVYFVSDGQICKLTRKDKVVQIAVSKEKLQNPWRIAISPSTGEIYVAENSDLAEGVAMKPQPNVQNGNVPNLAEGVKVTPGSTTRHHQVKRFSPIGVLLKTYGKPEGRSDGVYVPADFRGITDIEADADGGFIVTEGHHTPPRRTARFNSQGDLIREWIGAQHYGVIASPEPNNPRHVWTVANADQPGLIRWEVDYEKKTSRVVEVYQDVFRTNKFYRVPVSSICSVERIAFTFTGAEFNPMHSHWLYTIRLREPFALATAADVTKRDTSGTT